MQSRFKLILTSLICLMLSVTFFYIKFSQKNKPLTSIKKTTTTHKTIIKNNKDIPKNVISSPEPNQINMLTPKVMSLKGTKEDNLLASNIITGSKVISATPKPSPLNESKHSESKVTVNNSQHDEVMSTLKVFKGSQLAEEEEKNNSGLDSTIEDDILDKDELIYSMNGRKKSNSLSRASKIYSGLKEPLLMPWIILLVLLSVLVVLLKFANKNNLN